MSAPQVRSASPGESAAAAPGSGDAFGAVLVPNLGLRYSGVTSVIRTTLPHLQRLLPADLVGFPAGEWRPRLSWARLRSGFRPPAAAPFRIWHARRNVEMVVGLALRLILRWPLRIVFTAAGDRRRTGFTNLLLRQVDAVIATSEQAASVIAGPSVIVPHGIDCDQFSPVEDRAAAWRARGLGGAYGIGVFGRVRRQKGTDLFVDAMIALLPRHPEATAVVVGLCQPEDALYLAACRSRIAAAGLDGRIHILGEVTPAELRAWLACVSICVAPQRREGFGLVPMEAAASGTAVVATRVGAAELIVADGMTGRLVPPDDPAALAEAIGGLMADPATAAAMGQAGRRRAVEEFAIGGEVARYAEVYRGLWRAAGSTEAAGTRPPPTDPAL